MYLTSKCLLDREGQRFKFLLYSREKHDAGVGHGEGQTEDAAAHDGVAQVEDGHPKGGVTRMLHRETERKRHEKRGYFSFSILKNTQKSQTD